MGQRVDGTINSGNLKIKTFIHQNLQLAQLSRFFLFLRTFQMFDNVKSLKFFERNDGDTLATAMVDSNGEVMDFRDSVIAMDRVEIWMNLVLAEMRKTNRYLTKKAIFEYGKIRERSRVDWILAYQGMVCLAANAVWWTAEVEEVFAKVSLGQRSAMKNFLNGQNKQIDDLVLTGTKGHDHFLLLKLSFS